MPPLLSWFIIPVNSFLTVCGLSCLLQVFFHTAGCSFCKLWINLEENIEKKGRATVRNLMMDKSRPHHQTQSGYPPQHITTITLSSYQHVSKQVLTYTNATWSSLWRKTRVAEIKCLSRRQVRTWQFCLISGKFVSKLSSQLQFGLHQLLNSSCLFKM